MYPRNMVCFRYVTVNTLHKGDKKMMMMMKMMILLLLLLLLL